MELTIISVVGFFTVILSVLTKIVGLPDQIKINYKRKSTEGLSVVFFLLGFLSYVLWTVYGILTNDLVVALGQGVGVITMGIVAFQIYIYRGKK